MSAGNSALILSRRTTRRRGECKGPRRCAGDRGDGPCFRKDGGCTTEVAVAVWYSEPHVADGTPVFVRRSNPAAAARAWARRATVPALATAAPTRGRGGVVLAVPAP